MRENLSMEEWREMGFIKLLNLNMQDSLKMEKCAAKANVFGKMGLSISVIIRMESKKGMDNTFMKMGRPIREFGKEVNPFSYLIRLARTDDYDICIQVC